MPIIFKYTLFVYIFAAQDECAYPDAPPSSPALIASQAPLKSHQPSENEKVPPLPIELSDAINKILAVE